MAHWTDHLEPGQPEGPYLSWKQVAPRVGISRTTAWRLQKAGAFPKPYVLSAGRVAYRQRDVEAWLASRRQRGGRASDAPPSRGPAPTAPPPEAAERTPAASDRAVPTRTALGRGRRRPPDAPGSAKQITFEF